MEKFINVAFAADKNYIQPLSVAIVSILMNAKKNDNLHFYILCNDVPECLKLKLQELKKIKNFEVDFF